MEDMFKKTWISVDSVFFPWKSYAVRVEVMTDVIKCVQVKQINLLLLLIVYLNLKKCPGAEQDKWSLLLQAQFSTSVMH